MSKMFYLFGRHLFALFFFVSPFFIWGQLPLSSNFLAGYNGCPEDAGGYIFASPFGGTPPYTYLWSNGSTASFNTGLYPGAYSVTITDASQASIDTTLVLVGPEAIILDSLLIDFDCISSADVEAFVSGGAPPYSFTWSNGDFTSSTTLPSGPFLLIVEDQNNCTLEVSQQVPSTFELEMNGQNESCFMACDAFVGAIVSGGTPPYSYTWSDNSTNPSIFNAHPGTYYVTVVDQNGCQLSDSVTITGPDMIISNLVVDVLECGDVDGVEAVVNPSGGVPPYQVAWSNGQQGYTASGLVPGQIYSVTVIDSTNCYIQEAFSVVSNNILEIAIESSDYDCQTNMGGTAEVFVTSGQGPFTYEWNTGSTQATIFNLDPGLYTVTVENEAGCSAVESVYIGTSNSPIDIFATVVDPSTCDAMDGSISLSAMNGQGPYFFSWEDGFIGDFRDMLGVGVYNITVTDPLNCPTSISVQLQADEGISVQIAGNPNLCSEGDSVLLMPIVTDGQEPFTYNWSDGSTDSVLWVSSIGLYELAVVDANGCPAFTSVQVSDGGNFLPGSSQSSPSCAGQEDGYIGLSIFSFKIGQSVDLDEYFPSGPSIDIANFDYGLDSSTICYDVVFYEMQNVLNLGFELEYDSLEFNFLSIDNLNMEYLNLSDFDTSIPGVVRLNYQSENLIEGTSVENATSVFQICFESVYEGCANTPAIHQDNIFLETTSGISQVAFMDQPFQFLWSTGSTLPAIFDLGQGEYSVTIVDEFCCAMIKEFELLSPDSLNYDVHVEQITCPGEQNGSISIQNITPPNASILWSTGATTSSIGNLGPGWYSFTLSIDNSNCSVTDSVLIQEPEVLEIDGEISEITCLDPLGAIDISVSGGTPPYSYLWNDGVVLEDRFELTPGTYIVTVTDNNGCEAEASYVLFDYFFEVAIDSIINVGCQDSIGGAVYLDVSGSNPPFIFEWSNGLIGQEPFLENLEAGPYEVTVCDAFACCETLEFAISELEGLSLDLVIESPSCFADSTGSISSSIVGGVAPYSYLWSTGDTTPSIENIPSGTYSLLVEDAQGCSAFQEIQLESYSELTFEALIESTCVGLEEGSIEIIPEGESPFTILWEDQSTDFLRENLGVGLYPFTLFDANGCSIESFVELEAFDSISTSIALLQPVLTCQGEEASIELIIEGGESPYIITWNNGANGQLLADLSAGIYEVTVEDANGCLKVDQIEIENVSSLGDYVWYDDDNDGVQDADEIGVEGIQVDLFQEINGGIQFVSSTTTDVNGFYLFEPLAQGEYYIEVSNLPLDYDFTIQNATSDDLDSDIFPNGLSEVVSLASGECYEDLDAGINDICVNVVNAGVIGPDQYLCGPGLDPGVINEIEPASGGDQPYEYLWLRSLTGVGNPGSGGWIMIPNTNSPSYDPGPLTNTTYFLRCVRTDDECGEFIESNIVKITVDTQSIAMILGDEFVCAGQPYVYEAFDNGSGTTYSWVFGPNATPSTSTSRTPTVVWDSYGQYLVQLTVTRNDCVTTAFRNVWVTSSPSICGTGDTDNSNSTFSISHDEEGIDMTQNILKGIEVVPTAFDDYLEVRLHAFDWSEVSRFDLFDQAGRFVNMQGEKLSDHRMLLSNTSTWTSGVYIIRVVLKNGEILTTKAIKI